ncbi:MAG: transcription antitermination factor NusB [Paludibacteraceae bacterium]
MINRALLRIKIIQIIYSYYKSEGNSIPAAEKELFYSIEKTYQLYFNLLWLSVKITDFAALKIDSKRNKLRPTDEDLNPNTRFIDNLFIKQLGRNNQLKELLKEYNFSLESQGDIVKHLYDNIVEADFYKEYMEASATSYDEDKELWRKIYKKVFLVNEELYETVEDLNIYLTDDLEVIISFVIKTIKRFKETEGPNQMLLPMFKDDADKNFASKLLTTSLKNGSDYRQMIDIHTKNWELDRIAFMDIVIMEAALAEITSFPTIPINVTLNEYIEISKSYSTEKSAIFINGVLDNIVRELKADNKLIKVMKI